MRRSARDLGPRSPDDHYVLYTGGTTGMPKGVLWRHEDIFFGAMGGGNPGGPPIERPAEIAVSVLDNPPQRLATRSCPPTIPGPTQFVSLALGPLMHASGQWSAIGTLLGGGKVVLYDRPHVDMEHVLDLIEREHVNAMNLVGDASARPLLDGARPNIRAVGTRRRCGSSVRAAASSPPTPRRRCWPRFLRCSPSSRASARRSRPPRRSPSRPAPASTAPSRSLTFAAKAETIVVDDDLRPVARGSGVVGRLATRGRVPIGYYKDPGSQRADVRGDRRRALVAARRHGDHRRRRNRAPPRARLALHQHRRREGVSGRGRGGA